MHESVAGLPRYTVNQGAALTSSEYEEVCCALAGVCIIALAIRGSKFAGRVWANWRRGKHWSAPSCLLCLD